MSQIDFLKSFATLIRGGGEMKEVGLVTTEFMKTLSICHHLLLQARVDLMFKLCIVETI